MTLFAIAFGSSVVGFIVSKILCDREAQKVAQTEKTKTQLDEGKHLLILEERDSQVQSLIKQNDLLKEELELTQDRVYVLENHIELSKTEVQEKVLESFIEKINHSNMELRKHIESSASEVQEHITKSVKKSKTPQRIVCGSTP